MSLLLCSNGLTSQELREHVKEYGGKTAALVVTADHIYKAKNYHVPRAAEELKNCGCAVSLFDIDVQPVAELLRYDLIEFIGGNPYYLLKSLRECRGAEVLKRLAQERLLIGWSAGAMVMGPTIELAEMFTPEMNLWDLTDLTGMMVTDVQVLPHYSRLLERYDHLEERCRELEKRSGRQIIRLDDGHGVLVHTDGSFFLC